MGEDNEMGLWLCLAKKGMVHFLTGTFLKILFLLAWLICVSYLTQPNTIAAAVEWFCPVFCFSQILLNPPVIKGSG